MTEAAASPGFEVAGADSATARVRHALVDAAILGAQAAALFTLALIIFRLDGTALAAAISFCVIVLIALEGARRQGAEWFAAVAGGTVFPVAVGGVLGIGLALVGTSGHLLFLPVLFVLLALAAVARPGPVAAAALLAAAGAAAPALADGTSGTAQVWAPLAGLVLVVVPLAAVRALPAIVAQVEQRATPVAPAPAPTTTAVAPTPTTTAVARTPAQSPIALDGLTPRQSDVVRLICQGRRHAEIATELGISVGRVRRLLQQARERTGASTTRELVARVVAAEDPSKALARGGSGE